MLSARRPSRLPPNSGDAERMFIAPASVFLPNRIPCGPRSTSICSRSNKPNRACRLLPKWTPSTKTPTDCSNDCCAPTPMPRMLMMVFTAFSEIDRLGTYAPNSRKLAIAASWTCSPLTADTDIGTSLRLCSRFWAVTTISSSCCAKPVDAVASATSPTSGLI